MSFFHLLPYSAVSKLPTLCALLLIPPFPCGGGTYSEKKSIYDTLLNSSTYNPEMRPLLNQSDIMYVDSVFELVSIVEINDVVQSFHCNGFLGLRWYDELISWDPADYGGEIAISPKVQDVFRPRMVMLNTLEDRDLFEDDYAPFTVYADGLTVWSPGSIFRASCKLDLTKYPFDEQTCSIEMIIMNFDETELLFMTHDNSVGLTFFTENGQWEVTSNQVTTPIKLVRGENLSSTLITFQLKRKPVFLMISMILPIVFLSLLNLLVFAIPVDSGEKISYGITVLLALSVFMSIMSGLLPMSSESMPLAISYIFSLMVISVLTVVDSVIIVRLHHMEEREERSQRVRENFQSTLPKINVLQNCVHSLEQSVNALQDAKAQNTLSNGQADIANAQEDVTRKMSTSSLSPSEISKTAGGVNKYKLIGKHIDIISLFVFGTLWIGTTLGFMIAITT